MSDKDEDQHQTTSRSSLCDSASRDKRSRGEHSPRTASPRKRRHINHDDICKANESRGPQKETFSRSPLKAALNERSGTSALVIENATGLNNAPCFVRTSISVSQLFSIAGGQVKSFHDQLFGGGQCPSYQGQYFETLSTQSRQYSTYSVPYTVPQTAPHHSGLVPTEVSQVKLDQSKEDPAITDRLTLPREWEYTESGVEHEQRPMTGLQFSVMSYNVLAQKLLEDHSYLYEGARTETLQWQYRRELLLEEIASHNADIMCLQEVQEDHFQDFFQPQLEYLGYRGIYQKRTGDKCDGCATFYKLEKFSLGNTIHVEYCRGGLLDRDNIALIVELVPRAAVYSGTVDKLCVANTHLLFNPRRGDIKLGQLMVLMAELDKSAHTATPGTSAVNYAPVILCGDFNCEPQSDLYKFVARGYLHYNGLKARILSGQQEGRYGSDRHLRKNFFCQSFGITDQCQYQHLVHERLRDTSSASPISSPSTAEDDLSTSPSEKESSSTENCHNTCREGRSAESHIHPESSKNDKFRESNTHQATRQETLEQHDACQGQSSTPHLSPMGTSYGFSTSPADFLQTTMGSGQLWHRLNFVSSYKHTIARLNHQEEEVTTHHNAGSCSVDFIFYNVLHKEVKTRSRKMQVRNIREGKLKLLKRYGLMSQHEIYKLGGLPNPLCPSDHLPLISTFLLRQ